MKTMVTSVHKNIIFSIHNISPPSRDDWKAYLDQLRELVARNGGNTLNIGRLVFTEGGSPSTVQRAEVNALLDGRLITAAIVTDSAVARSVVTALHWFNPKIQAFSPNALPQAFHYLGVERVDEIIIRRELAKMQPQVGPVRVLRVLEEISAR